MTRQIKSRSVRQNRMRSCRGLPHGNGGKQWLDARIKCPLCDLRLPCRSGCLALANLDQSSALVDVRQSCLSGPSRRLRRFAGCRGALPGRDGEDPSHDHQGARDADEGLRGLVQRSEAQHLSWELRASRPNGSRRQSIRHWDIRSGPPTNRAPRARRHS